MKNLLPVGGVVLLKNVIKKLVIIGTLQVNPSENKTYDYLGVPYPEGYVGSDNNFSFNHPDINDIIFSGYENPEHEASIKAMNILYNQKKQILKQNISLEGEGNEYAKNIC